METLNSKISYGIKIKLIYKIVFWVYVLNFQRLLNTFTCNLY